MVLLSLGVEVLLLSLRVEVLVLSLGVEVLVLRLRVEVLVLSLGVEVLVLSLSKKVDIGMAGCLENMSFENVVLWLRERIFLEYVLFSLYLYPLFVAFLNPLSTPSPPSLLSLLINSSPRKIKTSNFITFCFTNGTSFRILLHTITYFFNNEFYKLVKSKF